MSLRRVTKEKEEVMRCPPPYCKVAYDDDDVFNNTAQITGPEGTPFEGGVFNLTMNFSSDYYPYMPPKVTFITPIYHPNISREGFISLNILQNEWSPALTCRTALLSIVAFLSLPNPDDPIEPEIAIIYQNDKEEYNSIAREWTRLYASPQLYSS